MYVIHVHVKGRKHGKVKGNIAHETNDYLWMVHESWCHANPPLHWIDNHNRDKEYKVTKEKIIWQILEKNLVGVANEVKRIPMDQKRMKGLAKIN